MKPKNVHKIDFWTNMGDYEFKVMPFGLTNPSSTFQELMNHVFQPYLRKLA